MSGQENIQNESRAEQASPMDSFFQGNVKLPSPPVIAVQILDVVKKDDKSFGELARIISADPALTAKILKVANSSFYALSFPVTSIEKALSVLGADVLKNIALSFVIATEMRRDSEGGFDFDFFWKRSITAAVGAELIGKLVGFRSDDTFVSALLQDIGIALMYFCRPNDYLKVLEENQVSGRSIAEVEEQIFGFDHSTLGAEALRRWSLPENILEPIRYHHRVDQAPQSWQLATEVLSLSDKISSVYHGSRSGEKIREVNLILEQKYKIAPERIEALIDAVAEKSIEILSSFEIDAGDMRPFSQILQEANEELGKLNLSYEQLVMEFKQAKEKAERLAQEVMEANEKLREMAFRDGLTGLYNHRYFQELMDKELSRAGRYKRPFSLILFDIDHFKKVNDTYGHPAGDLVLKTFSAKVLKYSRTSDIAARYGGEEFAIVLPETDATGAKVMAERLRRAIEQTVTVCDGVEIRATISIGCITYLPELGVMQKAQIIEATDKALYHSKHNGRNRVTAGELGG